jgi:hypothetical protein
VARGGGTTTMTEPGLCDGRGAATTCGWQFTTGGGDDDKVRILELLVGPTTANDRGVHGGGGVAVGEAGEGGAIGWRKSSRRGGQMDNEEEDRRAMRMGSGDDGQR